MTTGSMALPGPFYESVGAGAAGKQRGPRIRLDEPCAYVQQRLSTPPTQLCSHTSTASVWRRNGAILRMRGIWRQRRLRHRHASDAQQRGRRLRHAHDQDRDHVGRSFWPAASTTIVTVLAVDPERDEVVIAIGYQSFGLSIDTHALPNPTTGYAGSLVKISAAGKYVWSQDVAASGEARSSGRSRSCRTAQTCSVPGRSIGTANLGDGSMMSGSTNSAQTTTLVHRTY